eukprot:GHVP01009481.1.p1 GENE.GHVP01009481.1~~GHVP01009481.1.p1  ORF type:complete len:207 (+),score=28.45 GHVP01009481.1:88-708(+)
MEIKHLADQFGSALEEFGTPQGTVCCLHDELIPENDANPLEPEFRSIYRIDRHAAKNSDQEDKVEIIEIVDLGLKKESKILEILQKKDQRFVVEHQGEEKFSSAKNVEFLVKHEDSNVWSITTCDCRQTLDVYGRFTKYTVKDRCLTDCAKYKKSIWKIFFPMIRRDTTSQTKNLRVKITIAFVLFYDKSLYLFMIFFLKPIFFAD